METSQISVKEAKEHAKRACIIAATRWKHRRRMAYIALLSMLVVTYWCLFNIPVERLTVIDNIISWFFITMGSIVGAYVGFATLDDKWKEQQKTSKDDA